MASSLRAPGPVGGVGWWGLGGADPELKSEGSWGRAQPPPQPAAVGSGSGFWSAPREGEEGRRPGAGQTRGCRHTVEAQEEARTATGLCEAVEAATATGPEQHVGQKAWDAWYGPTGKWAVGTQLLRSRPSLWW